MKQKLLIEKEAIEELKPYIDAEKNALNIETLYDCCFRKYLKYDDLTDKEHDLVEEISKKCYEHFHDN